MAFRTRTDDRHNCPLLKHVGAVKNDISDNDCFLTAMVMERISPVSDIPYEHLPVRFIPRDDETERICLSCPNHKD